VLTAPADVVSEGIPTVVKVNAENGRVVAYRRPRVSNVVGTALTPFAEANPVVGMIPMKAAIGRLLSILTVIDVSVK